MDYLLCGAMGKKRASEQGGGGDDDDLVAFSRVPLQGHTREASERASSAREEFAFHLSRHHLRAWAAFLRRCLKVAGAVSLQSPLLCQACLSVIRRPRKFSMTVEFL